MDGSAYANVALSQAQEQDLMLPLGDNLRVFNSLTTLLSFPAKDSSAEFV